MALAPVSAAAAAPAAAAPPTLGRHRFADLLRAQETPQAAAFRPAPSAAEVARSALASVERARDRLEAVLAAARAGRTFSAGELLALQADAYRYAQTVDVASKLVEHGAQALKTAVNTQV